MVSAELNSDRIGCAAQVSGFEVSDGGDNPAVVVTGRGQAEIQDGAAVRDRADRVDEFADIGDAVFEQVADTGRLIGEELSGGAGLDVLGEDEHAYAAMVTVDRLGGSQPLAGMSGRHAPVDDGHGG